MQIEYIREYSPILDREVEFKRYGYSGKPVLVFPSQDGNCNQYEEFGMIDVLSDFIEQGKIQVFCVGSVDLESWSDLNGNPRYRIEMQERWFEHICYEMVPRIQYISWRSDIIVTGCSMGGSHAGILFFRRPDLFDTLISLSGQFDARMFFGNYMDDLVYNNSVVDFLKDMPWNHPYLDLYRQKNIIICIGQGAWEGELLPSNRELDRILCEKQVPAWFDYWGFDVAHDWPWWRIQIRYFMEHIL
ncbi:MAG: esterase [Leptotrichia sp.]|jgi:putative esterase|uniref:esterase family protein n=1 Tax=Leptotrichia sp. oral taxon 498 TaxID=712368 RepID=UPI000B8CF710|nr:alpha/beta hydrolase-fold protein [Leptotrichia sp. oral taxon 498]ASQ49006.1 esterase [Leptotrichia sp. oral taxon 498]RKW34472.1 MAG: esterase [Leptotrichia sp.]